MRRVVVVVVILVLLAVARPVAQLTADPLKQRTPFQLLCTHDGVETAGYDLKQNGQVVQSKVPAELVDGTLTFDFPTGLERGTYVFVIEAYNQYGRSPSPTMTLVVTPGNPQPPTNLRIVVGGL